MTFECMACGWTEDGDLQPGLCPSCGSRMEATSATLPEPKTSVKEESSHADRDRMGSTCG